MKAKRRLAAGVLAAAVAVTTIIVGGRGPKLSEIPATQDVRYQATKVTWQKWGPGRTMPDTVTFLRGKLADHKGKSFVIKERGDDSWSRARNLNNTLTILSSRVANDDLGDVWLVRARVDDFTMRVRGKDFNPAVYFDHPDATQAVDIIIGTLMKRHPDLRIGGVYACRTVTGSWTLSQHSYGNAVDVFGTKLQMDVAAKDILDLTLKGYVPASQILWNYRNLLTGHYVYDHTNHIHFSGSPLLFGPCRRV